MITNKELKIERQKKVQAWVGYLIVLIAVAFIIAISWILYNYTVNLLTDNLRKREIAIVRTAAVQFDYQDLEELQTQDDYKKPEWDKVVKQLIKIRKNNTDIVFAYILRKDPVNPETMDFVADSHSLNPNARVDLDGNGLMNDGDSLNYPGQLYEDVPAESFDAYLEPTANKDIYEDQWGYLISGYAPIKDDNGNTVAIVAVDIRADDFIKLTRQTFIPFIIFITVLISILLLLSGSLISIWNKRIELVTELDEQKDELLGIVSHQLATPVSSFKWYIEMMIDGDIGKITNEQKKHLQSMQAITTSLVDLVSMILDVSRIQLGRMKVDKVLTNLNEFYSEIVTVTDPKAEESNIKFVHSISKDLKEGMLDQRLTRMTIENLLTNAIKYSKKGGTVTLKIIKKNNRMFCQVTDEGCGIPKKDQDKIFGKLYRASNVGSISGNGFGLFVAKGAIESQSGKIWFESTEGKGTTFFVDLPLD